IPLAGFEMASRLSYFLWNSMPDEELFRAAEANELATATEVENQARRMLNHPKARAMVADFHRQWLDLDRFATLARDSQDLSFDASSLLASWQQSLLSFVDFVYWGGTG